MRGGKYVILCVDDDPDILEYLRVVLEANDYAVVGASSAEAGLRAYRETPPDLVIADLMMEEIDSGTGFVKQLQAWGNRAPIYMLSSVGDNLNTNADYSALGLTGVFQKPLDSEVLLSLLKAKLK
ncbi:MAG: response regulator [Candidatus Latescibacteria bacterium]|nr:response regulator [Candidatus Latescibacterota bacterium]